MQLILVFLFKKSMGLALTIHVALYLERAGTKIVSYQAIGLISDDRTNSKIKFEII